MELLEKIKAGVIPSREEISALEFGSAQKAAAEIRRLYKNNTLIKVWKCTSPTISKFFENFQVAKTKGNNILVGQAAIDHLNKNRKTARRPKVSSFNQNLPLPAMEDISNSDVFLSVTESPDVVAGVPIAPKINILKKFESENGSYYYYINLEESTL